jgi:regulator of protease activity HflC (stomatin/prohibitin superfamily)
VVIVGIIYWSTGVYIVHQAEAIVVERFGKFHKIMSSGINFVVPFVDRPKNFTWRMTGISASGHLEDTTTSSFRIDLRESVFNFMPQDVFTRDTVLVSVNALMFYRIVDVRKAVYEVDDLCQSLANTAQTQLKEVFGNMTFAQALLSQEQINTHLRIEFAKLFSAWGIEVERMELIDLRLAKRTISDSMKKQMLAERQRRGEFIRSEGKKAAMRLEAEGRKQVMVTMGQAEQEALRKRSEGGKTARIEVTTSEAYALNTLARSVAEDGLQCTDYMLAQRYMDLLKGLPESGKDLFVPYDLSSLRGVVSQLPKSFGTEQVQEVGRGNGSTVRQRKAAKPDAFSELN